jgi:hypothetical protein
VLTKAALRHAAELTHARSAAFRGLGFYVLSALTTDFNTDFTTDFTTSLTCEHVGGLHVLSDLPRVRVRG